MILVRLINMCLNETCSKVHIGTLLSDCFPVHNGSIQEDVLSLMLLNFVVEYSISKVQENRWD
jgi:hypothetical protein